MDEQEIEEKVKALSPLKHWIFLVQFNLRLKVLGFIMGRRPTEKEYYTVKAILLSRMHVL